MTTNDIPAVEIAGADLRTWLTDHTDLLELDTLAGLDDLLAALRDAGPATGWRQHPPLETVGVWRTVDSHDLLDGVIVTADLSIGDHTVRLASLHQDHRDIIGRARTSAVDTAMHALTAVATVVNALTGTLATGTGSMPPGWDDDAITDALNDAADDLLEVTDAGDEGLRDAVNLLVNAAIYYLRHPDATQSDSASDRLAAVAEAGYDEQLDTILGWIDAGLR